MGYLRHTSQEISMVHNTSGTVQNFSRPMIVAICPQFARDKFLGLNVLNRTLWQIIKHNSYWSLQKNHTSDSTV